MATFQNQATLRLGTLTLASNTVTGEYTTDLSITKRALGQNYEAGGTVGYSVNLVNNGTIDYTGVTLTDTLGAYNTAGGGLAYPLNYVDGSLLYYVNGAPQPAPTVTAGPPLTVTGIEVPAGGNVEIVFQTEVNGNAPLATGSTVNNNVTATGAGIAEPLTAAATVTVVSAPNLAINKAASAVSVTSGDPMTYTFTITNSGNAPVELTDNLTVTDTIDPEFTALSAALDGTPLTQGTDYTYTDGVFTTLDGRIAVPAATYTQDPATGAVTVIPGRTVLTVTGTVA